MIFHLAIFYLIIRSPFQWWIKLENENRIMRELIFLLTEFLPRLTEGLGLVLMVGLIFKWKFQEVEHLKCLFVITSLWLGRTLLSGTNLLNGLYRFHIENVKIPCTFARGRFLESMTDEIQQKTRPRPTDCKVRAACAK